MIRDLATLARDVDRLFRARQDGRQMPVGEVGPTGLWVPNPHEAAAFLRVGVLDGRRVDAREHSTDFFWTTQGEFRVFRNAAKHLRTRRHVAMLALTEPAHFRACLDEVDNPRIVWISGRPGNVRLSLPRAYAGTINLDRVRATPYPEAKEASDVARTAKYLVDLEARLTEYREAEARHAAIEAGRLADAAPPPTEAEPMDREDEAAVMEIA